MGAPSDSYVLETMADALDALASKLWYEGEDKFAGRLNRAATVLREPMEDDSEA